MRMLTYTKGDLFDHLRQDDVCVHIVNDQGLFGAGFALAVAERFPLAKRCYEDWFRNQHWSPAYLNSNELSVRPTLGDIQVLEMSIHWELAAALTAKSVEMTDENKKKMRQTFTLINMIAQQGVRSRSNPKPIKYDALAKCLSRIPEYALKSQRIIMPKIGTGFAGGDWKTISRLIEDHLKDYRVVVFTK